MPKLTVDAAIQTLTRIFSEYLSSLPPDVRQANEITLRGVIEDVAAESVNVVDALRSVQGTRNLTAFADDIGCSPSYISDVYTGKRSPGPKLLDKIGVVKNTSYTKRWR